ncbi:glycosyltransferase [Nocardioides panacihumi]|uniref:Glycosyltransferase n=1 Tax=Nocardioides panacihumi TaxID=400774 RepID=A0ABN2R3Q5_9ACTN
MNRIPRLLVLASTYPGTPDDGTPAFVRDLAIRESEAFETLVVVPRVPGAPATEQEGALTVRRFAYFPRRWEDLARGAIIENLRSRRSRWLQVLPFFVAESLAVRRAVREFRPDVVHAHWIIPQGLVLALVAPRVPRIVTTLGGDLYALRAGVLQRLKAWVVRGSRAVTVMNEEMADIVRELGGRDVRVSPMGADLSAFRDSAKVARGTGPALRLLFVGRMVEKKGLGVLLSALRGLDVPVSLTAVGDGPLRAEMERQAGGLDVRFVGQLGRADLARAYAEADIVVVPSVAAASGDKDGLPVAMLEAMGSGCAIVASDLPGLNEAVVDGVSGILVPSGDPDRLAACLRDLEADRERVGGLGSAAAERAESFSVERVGDRYVDLLTSVLA